jgi:hypothetical protein
VSYIQVWGGGGGRFLMLHPMCAAHLVLYFWPHWGHCVILVCGWERHYYPFLFISSCLCVFLFLVVCVFFLKKKKKIAMLLIGMSYIVTVDCISLPCFTS